MKSHWLLVFVLSLGLGVSLTSGCGGSGGGSSNAANPEDPTDPSDPPTPGGGGGVEPALPGGGSAPPSTGDSGSPPPPTGGIPPLKTLTGGPDVPRVFGEPPDRGNQPPTSPTPTGGGPDDMVHAPKGDNRGPGPGSEPVPEPGPVILFAIGLGFLGLYYRRRQMTAASVSANGR
jgi:hypothetical protein